MKTFVRGVFLLPFLRLIEAGGDVAGDPLSAPNSEDADTSCKSQLETMKKHLEKVQNIELAAKEPQNIELAAIGQPMFPEDETKYVPPLAQYFHEVDAWLRSMTPQWGVAIVAILFGAVSVWNGPASFKFVVVCGTSLIAAGSARYEVLLLWPDLNPIQQIVVAVEVGLLAAYVLHRSFTGTKVIIGVTFGIGISMQMDPLMHTERWPVNACLIWYSACAFLGIAAFTVCERYVLAIVTSLLGGFLCASTLGFLVNAFTSFIIYRSDNVPAWLDVRGSSWLDFASELLTGEDAGIFKPYAIEGSPVSNIDFDKLLGRALVLVFFFIGLKRQWRLAKETTAAQWTDLKASISGGKPADQILLDNQF